jgi:hypothetical protein
MKFRRVLLFFVLSALVTSLANAQEQAIDEIAELRAQLRVLAERLEALESQSGLQVPPAPAPAAPPATAASWADTLKLSGDFRYRHETVNDDAVSLEHRHRIRARVGITSEVADNMTVGFGLSTGGFTNDSGNQTLDEGFSFKDIGVDLAYFNWEATDEINVIAGKMSNPFFRPGGYHLIYDADLRPEGLAVRYSSGALFANASAFWVEERSTGADSGLFGLQGGYRGTLDGGIGFTAGASYYKTTHARGNEPFFTLNSGQGNQLDANGNYLYGFSEIELFGELRLDAGGQPMTLFADLVRNTDADAFDQGYAIGASYRRASRPGDWSVGYVYQDLEANAVVGAFTDSDFAGGTSDGSGHSLLASYIFPGGWNFGFRYIIGDRGEAAGNQRDYNRLQADISMRY